MVALCPLLEAGICNQLRTLNPKLLRWEVKFSRRFTSDGSQIHPHSLISRLFNSGYGGNHTESPCSHAAEWSVSQVLSLTLHDNCLFWGPRLHSLKPDVSGWHDTWKDEAFHKLVAALLLLWNEFFGQEQCCSVPYAMAMNKAFISPWIMGLVWALWAKKNIHIHKCIF